MTSLFICESRLIFIYIESKYFLELLDKLLSSSSISLHLEVYTYFFFLILQLEIKLASFTYAEAPTPGWTLFHQLAAVKTFSLNVDKTLLVN